MSLGRLPLDRKYKTLIGGLLIRVNPRTEFRRVQPGLKLIQIIKRGRKWIIKKNLINETCYKKFSTFQELQAAVIAKANK